jgi:hypothetical protein
MAKKKTPAELMDKTTALKPKPENGKRAAKRKKEKIKPTIKKENFTFDFKFNQGELLVKAKRVAELDTTVANLEAEARATASDFKSKIDKEKSEAKLLNSQIRSGKEPMTKTCMVTYDWKKRMKVYRYMNRVVARLPMTEKDIQLSIPMD